jgi:microcystin-dependent protein
MAVVQQDREKVMTRSLVPILGHSQRLVLASLLLLGGNAGIAPAARAQAADPYLGQVMWVGFSFCPRGWAQAAGQLLPIAQNTALFSLLGTFYGGNGSTTFALPDLRGRASIGVDQGPGLSDIAQGERGGAETQTLSFAQMPAHSHTATTTLTGLEITSTLYGSSTNNSSTTPNGAALGVSKKQAPAYASGPPNVQMAADSVSSTVTGTATTTIDPTNSGTSPVSVRDPYLGLMACIAVSGVFPPRD